MIQFKRVLCLLCTTILLCSFELEHPLFDKLASKGELCLTAENQHQFLGLQEALMERLKSMSKTRMHEVHELIHCMSPTTFPVMPGALSTIFSVDSFSDSATLNTTLSSIELDPQFSGRTYFLRDKNGTLQTLSFQEEVPCSCKRITFGTLDHQAVKKNVAGILDYLLEYDESFLALPYVKMIEDGS